MIPAVCRDCSEVFETGPAVCPGCGSARTVAHAELMDLCIAHIDCDAFYAAVEKRDNPALADKPVIVGHPGGRGVVTTACYVARRFGPRSAMPMFKALEMCPGAVVIPPDMVKYKRVGHRIRDIFRTATPVIEPVSLDEAYLDLSPEARLQNRPAAATLASLMRRIEHEVGITASVGLGANKFLAKLSSDLEKPRGFSVIGRAEAKAFLKALPVRKIMGVGPATAQRMEKLGIETIGQLQDMPEAEIVARFGRFGRRLTGFARGEDDRAVVADRPTKSVSAETTFAIDIRDAGRILDQLRPLCERVAEPSASRQPGWPDRGAQAQDRRLPHPDPQPASRRPDGAGRRDFPRCRCLGYPRGRRPGVPAGGYRRHRPVPARKRRPARSVRPR